MRPMITRSLAAAALVLATACGDSGVDPKPSPAGFTANVSGASTAAITGSAGFLTTQAAFTIALLSTSDQGTSIQFTRLAGTPAAGSYSLAPSQQSGNFVAVYGGGGQNNYVATGGTLTIAAVSGDRMKGSFSFTATGGPTGTGTITVVGNFEAARLSAP